MKIVDCREEKLVVDFNVIQPGHMFEYDDEILIKVESLLTQKVNAIDRKGHQYTMPQFAKVTPLIGHIVVEGIDTNFEE